MLGVGLKLDSWLSVQLGKLGNFASLPGASDLHSLGDKGCRLSSFLFFFLFFFFVVLFLFLSVETALCLNKRPFNLEPLT